MEENKDTVLQDFQKAYEALILKVSVLEMENAILIQEVKFFKAVVENEKD